ncbi:hypothetical protein CBS101457_005172 [Exobasidium rhododendri]|nr:hypothetical protein CBS101457_005172 [Exobasidium rhododendri]
MTNSARMRSPPLTSTPHPSTLGQRTPAGSSTSAASHHTNLSRLTSPRNRKSTSSNSRSSLGWRSANDEMETPMSTSVGSAATEVQRDASLDRATDDDDDSGSINEVHASPKGDRNASRGATGTMHTSDFVKSSDLGQGSAETEDGGRTTADASQDSALVASQSEEKSSSTSAEKTSEVMSSPSANRHGRMEAEAISFVSSPAPSKDREGMNTPRASKPNQERMKAYVMNSVRAINPLREAQLRHMTPRRRGVGESSFGRTPLPGPSRLRREDDITEVIGAESFVSDASSTRDLTLPARLAMRANTSFPGIGASDGNTPNNARVDPARLQGYLHKINIQLESENLSLKEEKDFLTKQFNRAMLDCERMRDQLDESTGGREQTDRGTLTINDELNSLKQEIVTLRIGQEELNDMLDERDAELGAAERKLLERGQDQNDKGEADRAATNNGEDDLLERLKDAEEELAEEREAYNQLKARFEGRIKEAMTEADAVQRQAEVKLTMERNEAWAEIERFRLTSARTKESTQGGRGLADLTDYEERKQHLQAELSQAKEIREELEKRLDDDLIAYEDLEAEYVKMKEDFIRCEEELNSARDEIMDLQIVAEEKESEKIKLTMQLRQAKESTEIHQLREKVILLEAQLEGAMKADSSIRQATPLHKNIAHLRKPVDTPRSPAELSNASWLHHESTLGDKSVLRNLHELRGKVDEAHAETDEKLANLGTGKLAQMMVEMQDQVANRDEEIKSLVDREEKWRRRLDKIQCKHCKARLAKVDLNQSVNSRANLTTTTDQTDGDCSLLARSTRSGHQKEQIVAEIAEQLTQLKARWAVDRAKLDGHRDALNAEKQQWSQERAQLQGENEKLRMERDSRGKEAKENVKRMQEGTLSDLSRARRIIGEFEKELREDCNRFQEVMQSSRGLDEDGIEVQRELKMTKSQLKTVEDELKTKVAIFERLENELFEKSHMDVNLPLHVSLLELEVQKFAVEVEGLRNERNSILKQRQTLYHRHRNNQQEYVNMYEEVKSAREAITAHQVQLDEQIETIEKLHRTLTLQNRELETLHDDRDRLQLQRKDILVDVAALEMDLKRVREESKRFGSDLEKLRLNQEQTQTQKQKTDERERADEDHIVEVKRLQKSVAAYKHRAGESVVRHHAECQGLLLQIRYEKAKFMRESDLRTDLIQQKHYIMNVIEGLQEVDATTAKFLSCNIGGHHRKEETNNTMHKSSRFKVVAWTVVAICRSRIMAQHWRDTKEVKQSLREAHQKAKLLRQA